MIAITGLVAGGTLVVASAPAQAVTGVTVVSAPSEIDSSPKIVIAECPDDTVVYGAAGRIINGDGKVQMTDMYPDENLERVRVQALENDPYPDDWQAIAIAICGPDNGHNLVRVEGPATTNGSPAPPPAVSAFALCPDDQVLFGTGYKINVAAGNVLLAELEPFTNAGIPDQVVVEARTDNGYAGQYDLFAYGVCGDLGTSVVELVQSAANPSPAGTASTYEAETDACPQGTVTGVGGKHTDGVSLSQGVDGVLLDRFEVNDPVTRVTTRAWDNAGGNTYQVTAFAICTT